MTKAATAVGARARLSETVTLTVTLPCRIFTFQARDKDRHYFQFPLFTGTWNECGREEGSCL